MKKFKNSILNSILIPLIIIEWIFFIWLDTNFWVRRKPSLSEWVKIRKDRDWYKISKK